MTDTESLAARPNNLLSRIFSANHKIFQHFMGNPGKIQLGGKI